jgi:hypothetical protein
MPEIKSMTHKIPDQSDASPQPALVITIQFHIQSLTHQAGQKLALRHHKLLSFPPV